MAIGVNAGSLGAEQELTNLLRSVEGATIQHSGTALEHQEEKQQRLSSLTSKIEDILTSFPAEGTGLEGFSDAINLLSSYSVNTSSRGFLGKLVSGPSLPGIAADLFVSILNNNGHVWRTSPALSTVERHVSLELAKLFDLRGPYAGGVTVPGGAAGNMLAMLVARNIISPDVKIQGGASKKYAIFVSESAHYSISNAAQIVGLGSDSVIRVPTVDNEIMDVRSLENLVRAAVDSGKIPLMIAATSGTTVSGAFDPLDKVGAIARAANAWFHVDACWGGAVAFSDKLRHMLRGSELADSIAFNPHKMLGVPLLCAFLLARDLRTFWVANKLKAGYLFHENHANTKAEKVQSLDQKHDSKDWRNSAQLEDAPNVSEIRDLASLTVQCCRRSDATKMFLHWKYYGTNGIGREVEQAVDCAQHFARLLGSHSNFELLTERHVFAQVCFYWKHQKQIDSLNDRAVLNSRSTHFLYDRLAQHGWYIDHAPDEVNGEFLRVACTRSTTRHTVEQLFAKLVEVGKALDQ